MEITYTKCPDGYINVAELMNENLPRPRLRPTVLVTGWGEFLRIISVEAEV